MFPRFSSLLITQGIYDLNIPCFSEFNMLIRNVYLSKYKFTVASSEIYPSTQCQCPGALELT